MNLEVKKIRNANFEILRIFAMLLIFFHHAVLHGGTSFFNTGDFQDFMREAFYHGGKLGVSIFVMISAYFLCQQKFNWRKVIILMSEVFIFSVVFLFIIR